MLAGLIQRDVSLLRDGIERVADVTEAVSAERLERALARLMAENIRPTGTIEPTVLQDLVRMLSEFGIRLPGDLVVLSRALVTLEGTLRVIWPMASMVAAASEMVSSSTAPVIDRDTMIRDELVAALPHLRHLPDRIDRILTLDEPGELRIRSVVDEDGQRILRTLVNRALLSPIGSVFLHRGDADARRRRRRARSWRAVPDCSRSSATAACSPAPCSCSEWRPPSLATGRRDGDHVSAPSDADRRSIRAHRRSTPRRRASGTSATRATSVRLGALGEPRRCCWPSSSRSARTRPTA